MSHINRVRTKIKTAESLQTALNRLASETARMNVKISPDLHQNALALVDYYGKTTMCAAMIDRNQLGAMLGTSVWGGIGWVWNSQEEAFDLAVDHIDVDHPAVKAFIGKVNQAYSLTETLRHAEAQGYTYQVEELADGTQRVLLNRY